jgi:hypothetical protein
MIEKGNCTCLWCSEKPARPDSFFCSDTCKDWYDIDQKEQEWEQEERLNDRDYEDWFDPFGEDIERERYDYDY